MLREWVFPPLCFNDGACTRQGWAVICKYIPCSKATGRPSIQTYWRAAGRTLPQILLQFLNTNCPISWDMQVSPTNIRDLPGGSEKTCQEYIPAILEGSGTLLPIASGNLYFRSLPLQGILPPAGCQRQQQTSMPAEATKWLFSSACHLKIAAACACCT